MIEGHQIRFFPVKREKGAFRNESKLIRTKRVHSKWDIR